jgi:hypothetical protein
LELTVVGLLDENKLEANMAEFVKDQVNTLTNSAKNSLDRVSTTMIKHQTVHDCLVKENIGIIPGQPLHWHSERGFTKVRAELLAELCRYLHQLVTYMPAAELLPKFWERLGKTDFLSSCIRNSSRITTTICSSAERATNILP